MAEEGPLIAIIAEAGEITSKMDAQDKARIIATTVTIKTDISSVPGVTKEITDIILASSVAAAAEREVLATSALAADNSEDKGEATAVDTRRAASLTRNKGQGKETLYS